MLSNDIAKLIGEAMKARDEVRLSTLRMLSSAFNYEKIEKQHELTEEEELAVIRKQAKQRKDSAEAYASAGDKDREGRELQELKILQEFLPPEMPDEELGGIIDESINSLGAKTLADMGKVIGMVKSKAPGVDGRRVAEIFKSKLKN